MSYNPYQPANQQFHYSAQLRMWIIQIMRIFGGFSVQYGLDSNGGQVYSQVPIIWGDGSMQAATIQRLNSENLMPSVPMMSIYINNLKYDRSRMQSPTFVDSKTVRTRVYDPTTNSYLPKQASAYTVKKLMPAPYTLEVRVDIVTSNTTQKLQILEQLLPLFNPALEIQKTDNYLDWESLSYLELVDTTWSSRTIPVGQGSDTGYDITTLQFTSPIWITLPAHVSKMGVIFKTVVDIHTGLREFDDLVFGTRQSITFNNYGVYVQPGGQNIKILNQGVTANTANTLYGQPLNWNSIIDVYGNIRPGVSELRLTFDHNYGNEIVGTITVDPTDATNLLYVVDSSTLPSNTLPAINAIVDPLSVAPGIGLANANIGQSYIITSNIGTEWPYDTGNSNASATVNDIITYTGNSWVTSFDVSENIGNIQFVQDLSANLQYQFNGNSWVLGWEGPYTAAHWRFVI